MNKRFDINRLHVEPRVEANRHRIESTLLNPTEEKLKHIGDIHNNLALLITTFSKCYPNDIFISNKEDKEIKAYKIKDCDANEFSLMLSKSGNSGYAISVYSTGEAIQYIFEKGYLVAVRAYSYDYDAETRVITEKSGHCVLSCPNGGHAELHTVPDTLVFKPIYVMGVEESHTCLR